MTIELRAGDIVSVAPYLGIGRSLQRISSLSVMYGRPVIHFENNDFRFADDDDPAGPVPFVARPLDAAKVKNLLRRALMAPLQVKGNPWFTELDVARNAATYTELCDLLGIEP